MKRQLLRRIYNALKDIDSEIEDGDDYPAFNGATADSNEEKGVIWVTVSKERFCIQITPLEN